MSRRHALTDEQWNRIEGLLPGKPGDRGRAGADNRLFVDAVLHVAKAGHPWRDLPERFGKWNSVWRRFDRWCAKGVWKLLAKELGELDLEELQLDSNAIKAVVAEEWEERIATVTATFLGLTVACARCHDHKHDPITNADYYALAGIINSTRLVDRSDLIT